MQTETKLKRIAWLSKQDTGKMFDCLMHHVDLETLTESFNSLDESKAVGADGVSKAKYGLNLNEILEDLIRRMKQMAYRPAAVREVLIPKEGQPGKFRPLGIGNFEDKVVQGAGRFHEENFTPNTDNR
ncbi:MAG: RNA-directed DNA polymerase [Chlamydiales bacterium]|jgi:RNA-directed DNA polymerase